MKLLVAFMFLTSFSFGQTDFGAIRGTVVDEEGLEIPFARVIVYQPGTDHTVIVTGTDTDFDGKFRIPAIAAGVYDLQFSSIEGQETLYIDQIEVKPATITDLLTIEMRKLEIIDCDFGIRPPLIPRSEFFGGPTIINSEDIRRL